MGRTPAHASAVAAAAAPEPMSRKRIRVSQLHRYCHRHRHHYLLRRLFLAWASGSKRRWAARRRAPPPPLLCRPACGIPGWMEQRRGKWRRKGRRRGRGREMRSWRWKKWATCIGRRCEEVIWHGGILGITRLDGRMDEKMDEWLGGILKCPPLVLCDAKSRGLLLFPCSFSAIFPNGVLSAGWLAGGVPVSVLIYVGCVAFIFSSLSSLCFSHVRPSLFPFQWQRLFSFASFVGGSVDAILQGVDTSAPSVLHGGRMEGRQTDRQAPLQSCISLRRAIVRLSSHASGHAGFIFALVLGALRQNVLF
ncbi:hypothetical protein BC567DRAFT_221761 [Phyllosticta citribraziliensis]